MKDSVWIPIAAIVIPSIISVLCTYWSIRASRAMAKPTTIPQEKTKEAKGTMARVVDFVAVVFPILGLIVGGMPFWSQPNWYFYVLLLNAMLLTSNLTFMAAKNYFHNVLGARIEALDRLTKAQVRLKDALVQNLELSDIRLDRMQRSIERLEERKRT